MEVLVGTLVRSAFTLFTVEGAGLQQGRGDGCVNGHGTGVEDELNREVAAIGETWVLNSGGDVLGTAGFRLNELIQLFLEVSDNRTIAVEWICTVDLDLVLTVNGDAFEGVDGVALVVVDSDELQASLAVFIDVDGDVTQ